MQEQRTTEARSTRETGPNMLHADKRSQMNILRSGLEKRFDSVYEAFVFFDINGDWSISLVEMKRRLQNIGMHTAELENIFRSNGSDGRVGPVEFVQKLAWHPLKSDVNFAIELAMSRPGRNGIVENAKRRSRIERKTKAKRIVASEIEAQKHAGNDTAQPSFHSNKTKERPSSAATILIQSPSNAGLQRRSVKKGLKMQRRSNGMGASRLRSRKVSDDQRTETDTHNPELSPSRLASASSMQSETTRGVRRRIKELKMKWAEVDLSWRRKRLPFAPTSSTLPAYERRKRLFQLFKKLDTANTGTINISDISLLLKAMGHSFDKTELDRAIRPLTFSLLADDGGTECKAIDFADFCQWWAALDWFDSIGMAQHALSSASVRHLKREWLDEAEELKEDAKRQTRAQVEATEDQARAARWAARRFDSPAKPDSEPELQLEHPPPPPHHRQSESLPGSDGSNLNIQAGHGSDSKSQDSSSSTSHGASSLAADLRLPVGAAAPGRAAASHGDSESAAGFQLQPEPEAEQPTCQRDRDRDHDHDGRRASHGDRDRVSESPANTLSHSLNLKLAPSRPRHAGGPAAPAARKASDHGATGSAGGDGDGAQNLDVQVQVGRGSGSARDRSQPDSEAASERSQGPLGPPAPLAPAARADSEASRHGVGSEPSSSCGQPRAGPASETGTGEAQTRTRSSGWRPGPRPLVLA